MIWAILLISPQVLANDTDCTIPGTIKSSDFSTCEKLLHQGEFKTIISNFSSLNPQNLPDDVSLPIVGQTFYKGASYFGLFIRESSAGLRCEYAYQGLININGFFDVATSFAASKADNRDLGEWMLRANIFRKILGSVDDCEVEAFQIAKIPMMVSTILGSEMRKYLMNAQYREETFGAVYREINRMMSGTSDILAKIKNVEASIRIIKDEISREIGALGRSTERVHEFGGSNGSVQLNQIKKLNDDRQAFFDSYPRIDDLVKQKEEFEKSKVQNNASGNDLSDRSEPLKETLNQGLLGNSAYSSYKTQLGESSKTINSDANTSRTRNNSNEEVLKFLGTKGFTFECGASSFYYCDSGDTP